MSGACDYCHTAKALVFCRADSARLCLACDAQVRVFDGHARAKKRFLVCSRPKSQWVPGAPANAPPVRRDLVRRVASFGGLRSMTGPVWRRDG